MATTSKNVRPLKRRRRTTRSKGKRRVGGWFGFLKDFARVDEEERGPLCDLTEEEILTWADAYYERTKRWPNRNSGLIPRSRGETWMSVEAALSLGRRGLKGGSSVARFLAEHRGRYHRLEPPQLTVRQILRWADAWRRRTGSWPNKMCGEISGTGGMNWDIIDYALRRGRCGMPGGSSLATLLDARRGVRNRLGRRRLTAREILHWADCHYERTGCWPKHRSGEIPKEPGESWRTIDLALRRGIRGLRGDSSLARLLAQCRGVRNKQALPRLSVTKILAWADRHFRKTGLWPNCRSGKILEAPEETWMAVESALSRGLRGLPGGSSLVQLLTKRRGVRSHWRPLRLTVKQILTWADAFHNRHGRWPSCYSGQVAEAPDETWRDIHHALYNGHRGLPKGLSLARLLAKERGVRNSKDLPDLSHAKVVRWAKLHRRRTGKWPRRNSGPIREAPGETWSSVFWALYEGRRGLRPRTSFRDVLRSSGCDV